jgi:hypothetical protein
MTNSEAKVSTRRIVVNRKKLLGIHSVAVAVGVKPVAIGVKPPPV